MKVLVSLCLLAAALSAQQPPVRVVEVPLLDCSGLPCVDMATGSGKTLRLLIDTGNVNSYIDVKAAQGMNLAGEVLKGADGTGANQVQQAIVPGTKLGELAMGDFPFMVLDTTPDPNKLGEKPKPLPADGALAFSAFKNRTLQIDYGKHVLRISEPLSDEQPCPGSCAKLVIKRFGRFGPATLTSKGFTVNGQPVDSQIDTLFTGTMLIYPAAIQTLGLKKQSKSKHKEFFSYTQDGVKLARSDDGGTVAFATIPLQQDGPLYFGTEDGSLPAVSFDATVGSGLLSHAVITFDFKTMQMWMTGAGTPVPAP